MKPTVFVGSSGSSLALAKRVVQNLNRDPEIGGTVLWQEVFSLSRSFIESLEKAKERDFGVFIFAKDDRLRSRGSVMDVPRDNVVFEAGLMAGARGFPRMLILLEEGCTLLSDLKGFNVEKFSRDVETGAASGLAPATCRRDAPRKACQSLREACKTLRGYIKDEWKRAPVSQETKVQIENLLQLSSRAATFGTEQEIEDVRAFCHLHDGERTLRHIASFMGNLLAVDEGIDVSCDLQSEEDDWFIIRKAFRRKKFIMEEVDWARVKKEQIPGAEHVDTRLVLVAAHPIFASGKVRGTVCFDSRKPANQIVWTEPNQKDRLQATLKTVADVIGRLL